MFHEHRDTIAKLKQENARFHDLFDKHNELDEKISQLSKDFSNQFEIEKLKKEKLKIKDEVHNMIIDYNNAK
ncbi:hypothetical protein CRU98_02305 [Arcobacter sp. CECT 8986]|uniref:YdcH family protein n=1 Tax=Arcobacter sp. CECT 8986 TaxID=2044507 RepID=UPI001009CBF8|nr:DUF465 domain-containing protein [Arcobacter sp. CECT 8986]RXK01295.1 hypothetical protein CRU98_02305 [Arcobacter sp. CECT 8986]